MANDAAASSSTSGSGPATAVSSAAAAPGRTPPLQRERSREELEIARHLIEHSQSAVTGAVTSQQQKSQPPSSRQPRARQSASHPGPSTPPESRRNETRDAVMGGVDGDDAADTAEPSPGEHHDISDAAAVSAATTVERDETSPARTGSPSHANPTSPSPATIVGGQACSNCGTTKTPLWRRSPIGEVICNACGLYYKARQQMRPVGLKRGSAATTTTTPSKQVDGQPHDRATPASIQSQATYVSADPSANGTCPGGGRCNGTGGHQGCNGCPAYNNRVSKTAQVALQQTDAQSQTPSSTQPNFQPVAASVVVACQNCGTTITPLWRRDEAGNTICNACGLYHKLHGAHRPVHMKKAEIKRRKRVVPVDFAQQPPHGHLSPRANESADDAMTNPRSSVAPSESHASTIYEDAPQTHHRGPIPVDFTDAFRRLGRDPSPNHHSRNGSTTSATIPRKRSISVIADENSPPLKRRSPAPPPHSDSAGPEQIDPSLAGSVQQGPTSAAPPIRSKAAAATTTTIPSAKDARRAELQREAERMRQMLEQKERELAELGEG